MTPQQNPEGETPPPRVTVVVVSRNRAALLRRCLESLEKSEGRETLQIVVVDNGSSDGSAQLDIDFPQAQFIRLPKNFGLTKAMNLGWRAADAEYVFFLHDDTEADPGAAGCDLWPASVIPLGRAALHPAGSEARWHAILKKLSAVSYQLSAKTTAPRSGGLADS